MTSTPEPSSRQLGALCLGLALASLVVRAHAFDGFFLRDDLVWLDRVAHFGAHNLWQRFVLVVSGAAGERAHAIGYLHFAAMSRVFGQSFVAFVSANLLLHALTVALVARLAWRLSGRASAAAIAGVLFGVGGGTWEVAWPAAVQHQYLALSVVVMALGQLRFGRAPGWVPALATLGAALLATLSLESGPIAAAVPFLVEIGGRVVPASVLQTRASPRARFALAVGAASLGVPRLLHELTPALLSGAQPLDAVAADRYAVALAPDSLLSHLAELSSDALLAPTWLACALLALLMLLGVLSRPVRLATVVGVGLALWLALPFASMRGFMAMHYALVPSVGLALALGAALSTLVERVPAGARASATTLIAVSLTVHFASGIAQRARRDETASVASRAIAFQLPRLLEGRPPADLVLFGLPTGVAHPDYPLMLQHSIPLFVGREKVHEVFVVTRTVTEELSVDFVHFVPRAPGALDPPPLSLRLVDGGLSVCRDSGCDER